MTTRMAPRVVLIGPPGSGKTTVGRALARLLETRFHDTDAAVEAATGRAIADIFVEDGEPAFRALERAEVTRALVEEDGVLALGGGAPMDPESQVALAAGHTVVFLDVGRLHGAETGRRRGAQPPRHGASRHARALARTTMPRRHRCLFHER